MPEAVISNTSPLQYLYQLGQLTLLRHFYQQVTVPPAVVQELAAGAARGVALPVLAEVAWLEVRAPSASQVWRVASTLGAGEREALALALETPNALLLLDDGHARRFGRLLGLRMTGRWACWRGPRVTALCPVWRRCWTVSPRWAFGSVPRRRPWP